MPKVTIEAACLLWGDALGYRAKAEAMRTLDVTLRWDERYRESVVVDTSMTAGEVMDAAAEALELTLVDELISLPYSDSTLVPCFANAVGEPYWLDAVVKRDGSVTWNFDGRDVRLVQLLQSYKEQVIPGDPTRMILFLDPPGAGAGGEIDVWQELVAMWPTIEACLKIAGIPALTVGIVRGGMRVVRSSRRKWRGRAGDLGKYSQLLKIPRTTAQVAKLLSVSNKQAVAICRFFGLEEIDGSWRNTGRPDKKEVAELAEVIDLLSQDHCPPDVWILGLQRILGEPVGERIKKARPILRQLEFEKHMRDFPDSDPSEFVM